MTVWGSASAFPRRRSPGTQRYLYPVGGIQVRLLLPSEVDKLTYGAQMVPPKNGLKKTAHAGKKWEIGVASAYIEPISR